jgi:hypothetical protein
MTPPRRFRFGLRTLFVVVTVVACWCGYQVNWIRQRQAAIGSGDARIVWYGPGDLFFPDPTTQKQPVEAPVEAPWNLRLFGETGARGVVVRHRSDVERMRRLFPEASIHSSDPLLDSLLDHKLHDYE